MRPASPGFRVKWWWRTAWWRVQARAPRYRVGDLVFTLGLYEDAWSWWRPPGYFLQTRGTDRFLVGEIIEVVGAWAHPLSTAEWLYFVRMLDSGIEFDRLEHRLLPALLWCSEEEEADDAAPPEPFPAG